MKERFLYVTGWLFLVIGLIPACCGYAFGQTGTTTGNLPNVPKKDTSMNKSNTAKWKDEEATITYEQLNSARIYSPDTTLHTFQRNMFTQPWYRDMGNLGSPANNLLFTPEDRTGPSLGYHINDIYRLNADSLRFYNTSRPYSVFTYQLGSKLEQTAGIVHTQNIRPNWNFSVDYRKINSPGAYKIQRNNHDIAGFTTNYKSLNKRYLLYASMVYNKIQHDENGGLVNDSELTNAAYTDRKTVDAAYQNDQYSITRSAVTNVQRDFTMQVQQSYRWGKNDTTYNDDSTSFKYKLVPRFSITHKLSMSTEKHTYKDLAPDSLMYVSLFANSFAGNTRGYYTAGGDSVFLQQKWLWIDNEVLFNGFLGREGKQSEFSLGLGNRYDQFVSSPVSNIIKDSLPRLYYNTGLDRSSVISNYLLASIRKEALTPGAWEYGAQAKFFFSGQDAGNFVVDALIGRQLPGNSGSFVAGFKQQVNSAPYSYTNYENIYTKSIFQFTNESVTLLYATLESRKLRLSGGVRNYLIGDYIYINDSEKPAQYTIPFSITQAWIRKTFKAGDFFLDNELVFQQLPDNAPVNVPQLMGRHQLSYEKPLFHGHLKIVTGVEVRYNSSYHPAGYDALLNKFFYQNSTYAGNNPELALFLNFRIKRFRAYVMGDNLQQIFASNTILYTGTPVINYSYAGNTRIPVYAAPDAMIRFGFTWVLVN